MHRANLLWNRLTEPSPHIQGHSQRLRAQLLSFLALVALAGFVFWLLSVPFIDDVSEIEARENIIIYALEVMITFNIYLLSRTRHYNLTLLFFFGLSLSFLFVGGLTLPSGQAESLLYYSALLILTINLLFSMRATIISAVVLIGMTLVVTMSRNDFYPASTFNIPSFILTAAIFTLAYAFIKQSDQQMIRKQARKLVEKERIYRTLFEQSRAGVVLIQLDGKILQANSSFAKIIGYPSVQLEGLPIPEALFWNELSGEPNLIARLKHGETIPTYEHTIYREDGSAFAIDISPMLVRDEKGNPMHIQCMVRDITDRKHNEQQQFDLTLERERVEILQKFINDASHDFRTPLTNIKTTLYLVQRHLQHPEEDIDQDKLTKYVDSLSEHMHRLEYLLDDLLTLTVLKSNTQGRVNYELIDMNTLMREIVPGQQQRSEEQQLAIIHWEPIEQPLYLKGNRSQLGRAIINLIDNALTHTSPDGRVIIRNYRQNEQIVIVVRDTGIGIEDHHLPYIFDSFYRGDAARSTDTGRSGMGLAIAKNIVESHRGRIEVESEHGVGSTFRIYLPAYIQHDDMVTQPIIFPIDESTIKANS